MRRAQLRIAGSDRLSSGWEFVESGKTILDESQELTRVSASK
jgi:hypothetical protein